MAAVVLGISTTSTLNAASYASAAFTPAANDLLVVFGVVSGTNSVGTVTNSLGLTFTKVTSAAFTASADTIYCFVANALAAASSQTCTMDVTGNNGTGAVVTVCRISGMSKTGAAAIRRSATQANQAAATPAPAFSAAALTENPTLGVIGNVTNPPAITPPTNWTELADNGFATPTTGSEVVSRDSGFTGTTVTWGSASATAFGSIIVELDTSAASTGNMFLMF